MNVELVRTTAADGVPLVGALRVPAPGAEPWLPVDVMIMHHGVGGNFYNAHFQDRMGEALLERGCAVLRVNNRGHDLAYNSPAGRLGAAFEVVDDCRHDWTAWIDLAAARGYRRIGLWGHSLGAVKTIYFLAAQGDARVARAIASSPPRFSYSAYAARPDRAAFLADYERARQMIDAGAPNDLLAVDIPTSVVLTARTYVDKYGPDERYDILRHLPNVSIPLLVTIGGEEGARPDSADRFPFGGLADQVAALSERLPNLTFAVIPGADHFYAGTTDALWAVVERWLMRESTRQ
ncbi:MAG TPA: alpha/beta fold hydrolase [Chloroflexota bacterium]|nr:alpha/beta fold hydrolase [Chloroflexota bacterium]